MRKLFRNASKRPSLPKSCTSWPFRHRSRVWWMSVWGQIPALTACAGDASAETMSQAESGHIVVRLSAGWATPSTLFHPRACPTLHGPVNRINRGVCHRARASPRNSLFSPGLKLCRSVARECWRLNRLFRTPPNDLPSPSRARLNGRDSPNSSVKLSI